MKYNKMIILNLSLSVNKCHKIIFIIIIILYRRIIYTCDVNLIYRANNIAYHFVNKYIFIKIFMKNIKNISGIIKF